MRLVLRSASQTVGLLALVSTLGLMTPTVLAGSDDLPSLHEHFIRGDVNEDDTIEISDAIALLSYLFVGDLQLNCLDAADLNDDEGVDVGDAVFLLDYLFQSGTAPPAPLSCGPDPSLPVALSCNSYAPCSDQTSLDLAGHLMRRLGYGPSQEGIDHVLAIGASAYIDEQLHPELDDELDNILLQDAIAGIDPTASPLSLIRWQILHALYSRNQLREAQVDFWENHFNTEFAKEFQFIRNIRAAGTQIFTPQESNAIAASWESLENEFFRSNAFGTFSDLLIDNATSRTMIVYLDGYLNRVGTPNENYGRELLELHTMGVDNGYTQADIEQVARCFTGWTVRMHAPGTEDDPLASAVGNGFPGGIPSFHFARIDHDYGEKVIFAGTSYELTIPARPALSDDGFLDGFEVLEHLANLPQTAEFVTTKLVEKYVSDDAPLEVVAAGLGTWIATDGDLLAVMETILGSSNFTARENRWNKVETAFEYIASTCRAIGVDTNGVPLLVGVGAPQHGLIGLDQQLFFYPTPEGQSERGHDWMGATSILNRILFASFTAQSTGNPSAPLVTDMVAAGVDSTNIEAIVDYWLERIYQRGYDMTARTLAQDYLSTDADGVVTPLDPTQVLAYRERIRAFVGFVLSAPIGNQQ